MQTAPERATRARSGAIDHRVRVRYDNRFLELFLDPPFLELLRDELLRDALLRELLFRDPLLRGTFAPFFRASERPMAIACFRLFTVPPLPPGPLLSVPFFRRRIALPTLLLAARPYFRLPDLPPDFFLVAISPPCVTGVFDNVDAGAGCKRDAVPRNHDGMHVRVHARTAVFTQAIDGSASAMTIQSSPSFADANSFPLRVPT